MYIYIYIYIYAFICGCNVLTTTQEETIQLLVAGAFDFSTSFVWRLSDSSLVSSRKQMYRRRLGTNPSVLSFIISFLEKHANLT